MADTRPLPTRRQQRMIERFADRSDALIDLLDHLPDRRAPLDPLSAAKARSALAGAFRLLAGSGLRPAAPLPCELAILPGELLVALLSTHAALGDLLKRFRTPPIERYPRSRRHI